jgi:hypothetical protein
MDFYPVAKLAAEEEPVMHVRWNPEIPNSVTSLDDLAEATAKVLNEREDHFLAEYPLCSTLPISDVKIGSIISECLGRNVKVHTPTFEEAVSHLMTALFGLNAKGEDGSIIPREGHLRGDLVRDTAERLVLYYNRRGIKGNPNVMRWLLGREPTSVEQYVRSFISTNQSEK